MRRVVRCKRVAHYRNLLWQLPACGGGAWQGVQGQAAGGTNAKVAFCRKNIQCRPHLRSRPRPAWRRAAAPARPTAARAAAPALATRAPGSGTRQWRSPPLHRQGGVICTTLSPGRVGEATKRPPVMELGWLGSSKSCTFSRGLGGHPPPGPRKQPGAQPPGAAQHLADPPGSSYCRPARAWAAQGDAQCCLPKVGRQFVGRRHGRAACSAGQC